MDHNEVMLRSVPWCELLSQQVGNSNLHWTPSPHALWRQSTTLVVKVEVLSPELSISKWAGWIPPKDYSCNVVLGLVRDLKSDLKFNSSIELWVLRSAISFQGLWRAEAQLFDLLSQQVSMQKDWNRNPGVTKLEPSHSIPWVFKLSINSLCAWYLNFD